MSIPVSLDFRNKLLSDPELTASVKRVLRARGVEPQDLDDKSQDTLLSAFRAANLPSTKPEARQYVHAVARYTAIDWADERAQDPIQIAFATRPDAVRADEEGDGANRDGADLEAITAEATTPHAEEEAREAAELARKVVERVAHRHPRAFRLFWRAKVLGEPETDLAAQERVSAGRLRKQVSDARKWMHETVQELTTVLAVVFVLIGIGRSLMQRREMQEPLPDSRTAAPQGPTPLGEAARLRHHAFEACDAGRWNECVQFLDDARRLDSPGDTDARVQEARARAQAAQVQERNMGPEVHRDTKGM
jgi:DNA-directed RNA polymerase specialized sigma24 family protein